MITTMQTETQSVRFSWNARNLANRLSRRNSVDIATPDGQDARQRSDSVVSVETQSGDRRRPKLVQSLSSRIPGRRRGSRSLTALEPEPVVNTPIWEKIADPFERLPVELQLQVLEYLSYHDVLVLYRTSRHLHHLISSNQPQLVRNVIQDLVPPYLPRLYKSSPPPVMDFVYLEGLRYREAISSKLSLHLTDYITREIFRRTSTRARKRFQRQHDQMWKRMTPLIATLFHYFENYRARLMACKCQEDVSLIVRLNFERWLLGEYEPGLLLELMQMYKLLLQAFYRRMRPPSYAGALERSLRGWTRGGPPTQHLALVFVIGGIREVERIWSVKVYDQRRRALDEWIEMIRPAQIHRKEPKIQSGKFLGIGTFPRLKAGKTVPSKNPIPPLAALEASVKESSWKGLPMPPLSPEEIELIFEHVPPPEKHYQSGEYVMLRRKQIEDRSEIKGPGAFINDLAWIDGDEEMNGAAHDTGDHDVGSDHGSDGETVVEMVDGMAVGTDGLPLYLPLSQ